MPPEARRTLYCLLTALFNQVELTIYLINNHLQPEEIPLLPPPNSSVAYFVTEVIGLLERRGILAQTFFRVLKREFPRRLLEIDNSEEKFFLALSESPVSESCEVSVPYSKRGDDRMDGQWFSECHGITAFVMTLRTMTFVPYAFGKPDHITGHLYDLRSRDRVFVGRFVWLDDYTVRGLVRIRAVSEDIIEGRWWNDFDCTEEMLSDPELLFEEADAERQVTSFMSLRRVPRSADRPRWVNDYFKLATVQPELLTQIFRTAAMKPN